MNSYCVPMQFLTSSVRAQGGQEQGGRWHSPDVTGDQRQGSQARQRGEGQRSTIVLFCNRRAEEDVEDVTVGNSIDDGNSNKGK